MAQKVKPVTEVKTKVDKDLRSDNLPASEYLDTYRRQLEEVKSTYEWAKSRLTGGRTREWERTIRSLETVVKALEAGFDPIVPPKNWSSGQLHQYVAAIPEKVREGIDKAEAIFGLTQILIYDPNEEHFRRPRDYDPIAVGFVDLARQRLHFLIGMWDLAKDQKFISGTERLDRASQEIGGLVDTVGHWRRGTVADTDSFIPIEIPTSSPTISRDVWTTGEAPYTGISPHTYRSSTSYSTSLWVSSMVGDAATNKFYESRTK